MGACVVVVVSQGIGKFTPVAKVIRDFAVTRRVVMDAVPREIFSIASWLEINHRVCYIDGLVDAQWQIVPQLGHWSSMADRDSITTDAIEPNPAYSTNLCFRSLFWRLSDVSFPAAHLYGRLGAQPAALDADRVKIR